MTQPMQLRQQSDIIAQLSKAAASSKVLVVGAINYDELYFVPGKYRNDGAWHLENTQILPGGHAANCASALAQLGMETGILGAVGLDPYGDFLVGDLEDRGVDTSLIHRSSKRTGRALIPVFEDSHFMLLERGANDTRYEIDHDLVSNYDAVVLFDPPLHVLASAAELTAKSDASPCFWIPGGHYSGHPVAKDLVSKFYCVFLNAAEAEKIDSGALQWHKDGPAIVVETRGERGVCCYHERQTTEYSAFATRCVDPTGAGDLFAACFILADLAGLPVETRLAVGCTGGMIAVETSGARVDHLTFEFLAERLDRNGVVE